MSLKHQSGRKKTFFDLTGKEERLNEINGKTLLHNKPLQFSPFQDFNAVLGHPDAINTYPSTGSNVSMTATVEAHQ